MTQTAGPYQFWFDLLNDPRFLPSSGAILEYLELTEGLESPVPYHIWSFLSLVAALCGDNIALSHGPTGRERLNLGVILTGVPAIRKSTALSVMQKFAEGLPISYGPSDTGGQRQGIMAAMQPRWQRDKTDEPQDISLSTLEALSELDSDDISSKLPNPLDRKASEIYFVSKELGRLISSPSRELFDFFADGMDGESTDYQLKNSRVFIRNPLINLLGATTPASLGHMLPRGGDTHGFLSRVIFVHASTLSAAVPIPASWSEGQKATRDHLHERLLHVLQNPTEITLTADAVETYKDLYGYQPHMADIRLQAYVGRRAKHLLKVAAILGLLRAESVVQVQASDLRLAHGILALTEGLMDRAFYGLETGYYSRVLCAFAELAEGGDGIVSCDMLQAYAGHLGDTQSINNILFSLDSQGRIVKMPGTGANPHWTLNTKAMEMNKTRLMMGFQHGGLPGPDEFKSHKTGVLGEVKNKGAAG